MSVDASNNKATRAWIAATALLGEIVGSVG